MGMSNINIIMVFSEPVYLKKHSAKDLLPFFDLLSTLELNQNLFIEGKFMYNVIF